MSATKYSLSINYTPSYSTYSSKYSRSYTVSPRTSSYSSPSYTSYKDTSYKSSYSSDSASKRSNYGSDNSSKSSYSSDSASVRSTYSSDSASKSSYSSDSASSSKRPLGLPTGYSGASSSVRSRYTSGDYSRYGSGRDSGYSSYSDYSSRASSVDTSPYYSKHYTSTRKTPDPDDNYGDYIRSKLRDLGLDRIRDVPAEPVENDIRSRKVESVESRVRPTVDHPTIDRFSKPSATTIRSSVSTSQGSGLTGLKNLGNTCYMNSVLQCLTHIDHLKTYFLEGEYKNCLNANSRTRGHIAEKFASVYDRLWSGQNRSFACSEFKSTVGQYRPDWAGRDQQDADDFLVFLLDCLHEDLNRIKRKQPLKEQENDGKSDSEASRLALADWQTSNQSKISDLFYGQEKSALTCETCGHSSVRFDMICTLVVPIPPSVRHCELDDCLSLYTKGESIPDWNCPKCKQPREAVKKLDLYRTPKILVITLKRFLREGYDYWKKRQTIVDYPLTNLRVNGSTYRLVAVINHYGTLDGGHYTASAYHPDMKEWYKFDDSDVTPISASDAVVSAAYILFYSKIN